MASGPDRVLPDFIIGGFLKCGTTALWLYLNEHPRIFVSWPKEPNYFCEDFPWIRAMDTEEEYLRLFAEADLEREIVGEASVRYMYSEVAAERIRERNPDTRFIVMMRNPVDMVYSYHSQRVYEGLEPWDDFAEAWARSEEAENPFSHYREVGRMGHQVERLLDHFPRDQVHFVLMDEFSADTGGCYRRVLDFLGVPDDGRTEFEPYNRNKRLRWEALSRFAFETPEWIAAPILKLKELCGISELGILHRLHRANVSVEPRPPLDPELARQIADHFEDDVRLLSSLIGRDLSGWTDLAGSGEPEPTEPGSGGKPARAGARTGG